MAEGIENARKHSRFHISLSHPHVPTFFTHSHSGEGMKQIASELALETYPKEDILLEPLFTGQAIHVGLYADSPSDRIKSLTAEENVQYCPLYCEMLQLSTEIPADNEEGESRVWNESARWVKYEETVEMGGNRFSKPHLTLLTIQSILQLRNCLKKGQFLIDPSVRDFNQLVEKLIHRWIQSGHLEKTEAKAVEQILLLPKQHLLKNRLREVSGKIKPTRPNSAGYEIDDDEIQESLTATTGAKLKKGLMRKLPTNSEAAAVLVGHVRELRVPLSGFVRLDQAKQLHPELPDLPLPIRFVFVLLVPHDKYEDEAKTIGSAMGTLLVDEVFSELVYKARDNQDLSDGVEEFLSQTTILPAGKWNSKFRFEPIDAMPPAQREIGQVAKITAGDAELEFVGLVQGSHFTEGLRRTGRIFGGVVEDVKRKSVWYASDYTDVWRRGRVTQSIAAAIFLFFSNITKIITFGGVMGHMLDNQMASVENLLSGGICGVIYALFSGQPLCVLSATGPTLVFEAILYELCQSLGWSYLPARFWVGLWTAIIILLLVAFDASAIVAMITRFTEEAFATLISVIFIVQAFHELFELHHYAPIIKDPINLLNDPCICTIGDNATFWMSNATSTTVVFDNLTIHECDLMDGVSEGAQCKFNPDVFLMSVLLFFGTFTIAIALKMLRHSGFFPSNIRYAIADFGVFTAIVLMTATSYLVGLNVEKLQVPNSLTPTLAGRGWFVNPTHVDVWYIPLVAIFPALFFTILVVMDQQITSVIINRKDNKLRKGYGYHLDILVISLLMLVCATMGVPFYVAATVISIMHVDSLRLYSECSAPGEKPQFLGVKEQRVTALLAHIMIGLAVFLTPVIKLVPISVLLGIFLYMGVVSLLGQQFVQRIMIMFMPMKHQPDYPWLRIVHLKRVHYFTAIQIISLALLFVVKYIKRISIVFPIMLVVMVMVRKLLDNVFTQKELCALDDPLPAFKDLIKPQILTSVDLRKHSRAITQNGPRPCELQLLTKDDHGVA